MLGWVGFSPSAAAVFMVSSIEPPTKGPYSLPGFLSAQGLQPEGSPGAAVMPGHQMGSLVLVPPGLVLLGMNAVC